MSINAIKTKSTPQNGVRIEPQASKRGLLLKFAVFIIWMASIGILLSLVACQQNAPKIFVIKELVECKNPYQSNAIGMPILVSTLKGISLYVSRISCEKRSGR